MIQLKHNCESCDSEFTIKYDEEQVADDPKFCPFCCEMMLDSESEDDDDE